ncbi:MAG: T9SS type A sorting domain-containing protein [Bacteroidetes bacterium]|nr:T9SS type A sorting domain-containing protein [Bacteroidota bacterium]MBU1678045.1 T9SS type A sorting domain-containing protein [Bacteroidota bacterium]MBU2507641.1 T9SS type A sorting domain-containing protein [Bacteroidota bacterium]
MKQNYAIAILALFVMIGGLNTIQAQSHSDPAYIPVISAENPIVVDGVLDETDWIKRYDYLVFGATALPGDVTYTGTSSVTVKEPYTDSTLTFVKFLRRGLDLYISVESNDQSVGRFGDSWEGDGIFMKINDASGIPKEYKMYFNAGGVDPNIVIEGTVGTVEGAAWKHPGTIVNDTSSVDSGYTAEMVIHLDQLGYTDEGADIGFLINVFDPDHYTDGMLPWDDNGGNYWKGWWGSEWGPDTRILRLADPPSVIAHSTDDSITLDGELNESFWANALSVTVGKGSNTSTGGYYMQWNHPTNVYEDQSMATVKFMHKGTDLYIGVESDDASVCKWSPGWEADGLFLWMTNKDEIPGPGARMEIKNMFFNSTEGALAVFEVNGNVPTGAAEGASAVPTGTVTHTETNGADAGYSLEVVVHTDMFGYSVGDAVKLSAVIWDLDYASADAWTDSTADYAPNWWGTQWVDANFERYHMYREVILSTATDMGTEEGIANTYKLNQNYPNPFNPTTKISYSLAKKEFVSLKIYDVLGTEIATLINSVQDNGAHEVNFDATNLSTGVYFYTLKSGNNFQTRKMILIK